MASRIVSPKHLSFPVAKLSTDIAYFFAIINMEFASIVRPGLVGRLSMFAEIFR